MGIGVNLLLAGVKAGVGVLSGSIAVVLDAVNNLSDALSSLITLVGARLAAKEPDREHPLGHGRAEYLAGMIVAALVLYAGLTALMESGRQLFAPAEVSYAPVSLFLLAAAVAVKLFLGSYVKRVGERVSSASLVAAGKDALSDAALSASVLGSALLYRGTGLRLEAWVGAVIACFIVKAGVSLLRDAYDELLGRRVEGELVRELKATIAADEAVRGVHDLVLHAYGPERLMGSVHVEVPDTMTAGEVDRMERRIARAVLEKHGVRLTAVGIYAVSGEKRTEEIRAALNALFLAHDGVLGTHAFSLDEREGRVLLDVLFDFSVKDREALCQTLLREAEAHYPAYHFTITADLDEV